MTEVIAPTVKQSFRVEILINSDQEGDVEVEELMIRGDVPAVAKKKKAEKISDGLQMANTLCVGMKEAAQISAGSGMNDALVQIQDEQKKAEGRSDKVESLLEEVKETGVQTVSVLEMILAEMKKGDKAAEE
jgi:hypothetical protein